MAQSPSSEAAFLSIIHEITQITRNKKKIIVFARAHTEATGIATI
jgi:hypothetical protein